MMRPAFLGAAALTALATLALSACTNAVKPPFDEGVCYYVVPDPEGEDGLRYNVVGRDLPQLETCFAELEKMRIGFLRLGGNRREIMGAYNGQFIFIDATGISVSRTLDGGRFFSMARTGDGRLAVPGAIVRDETGAPVAVAAPPEGAPSAP